MSTIEHAVVKGVLGGAVEIRNIFTAQVTEIGADTSELLWDVYITDFLADIAPALHEGTHFYGYDVYQLNAGQWELIDEVTVNVYGEVTGEAIINAAAVVLIGKAPGIRHFGRKFMGMLGESSCNNNSIISGLAATLAAALTSYIAPVTGIGGGTLVPGIVDNNNSFHAFVGGVVSSIIGSMRRRKPGIGI